MRIRNLTLTMLIPALVSSALAISTNAQEAEVEPTVQDTNFLAADINANGELDREEFVSFAVMKAAEGHKDFVLVRENGSYDDAFDQHDSNADGVFSPDELASVDAKGDAKDKDWTLKEEPEQGEPADEASTGADIGK